MKTSCRYRQKVVSLQHVFMINLPIIMMKQLLFILALVLCFAQVGRAQTIRNTSNSALITIDDRGYVRTTGNSVLARIESNGTIRDNSNRFIGKIEDDGTIRDRNNSYLGKVESNGTVRNPSNSVLGKVESDGTVRDRNNHTLGTARGVPMRVAAIYFFFGFFRQ